MTDEPITPVIFRADRSGPHKGEVTAVFPTIAGSSANDMTCYAHIGQHGTCSFGWYRTTRPVTPEEYADLKRELESLSPEPYRLKVCRRITRKMDEERRDEYRRWERVA